MLPARRAWSPGASIGAARPTAVPITAGAAPTATSLLGRPLWRRANRISTAVVVPSPPLSRSSVPRSTAIPRGGSRRGVLSSSARVVDSATRPRSRLRSSLRDAPSLIDDERRNPRPPPPPPPSSPRWAKAALRSLSSLPLAIAELALIAGLSAVGTVIEQNKPPEYYLSNYPTGGGTGGGLASVFDHRVIEFLGWDHVYSSLPFLALCALLAASLAACTATRQAPALRVARSWRFASGESGVYSHARGAKKQGSFATAAVLRDARARDLARILASKGYQVFVRDNDASPSTSTSSSSSPSTPTPSSSSPSVSLYAFKGLAGKVGPIVVHASLLLTIAGATAGALCGWKGNALVPVGGEFLVSDALVFPASPLAKLLSQPGSARSSVLRVDGFEVVYRDDGSVSQFETDLSVVDVGKSGRVAKSRRISVNKPLRFGGVTAYQADYGMAALTVRVASASPERAAAAAAAGAARGAPLNSDGTLAGGAAVPSPPPKQKLPASAALEAQPFNLPFAEIQDAGGIKGRAWATFLPTGPGGAGGSGGGAVGGGDPPPPSSSAPPRGITLLARDFQTVVAYNSKGEFAGVRRPGSNKPLTVDGVDVVVDDIVGSSGLELKSDPGVPVVYAGFAGLMVSTLVSYLSHSQVWAWESTEERKLHVSGRTNRAALGFEQELEQALAAVPEAEG